MVSNKIPAAVSAPPVKENNNMGRATKNSLHKQLRKTKFCMFHLQGACQFGKDCAFAHSLSEMNGTPDLRKTQICKAFSEGGCTDPNCNFAHGEIELRSTDMFFKKSLCIWNEKGKCRNGAQCRFAHGLSELRSHQSGQQATGNIEQVPYDDINKDARYGTWEADSSVSTITPPSSKTSGRRKAKQSSGKSSNSSCSVSSSDNASSQQSAAEPMKVQPSAYTPQEQIGAVPETMLAPIMGEVKWRENLIQRLGALEADYMAMEAARWQQQQMPPMGASTLRADLENLRKGIGMLAAQCDQIHQTMQTTASKIPPSYMGGGMLQNSNFSKPYPDPESMHLLWQMQMQMQARA